MKHKKFLIYSGIALVVIVAVLLVLPFVINLDKYIPRITGAASNAIGRKVSIEHLRLTILSGLGVELKDVTVQEKVPTKTPFVHVEDVDVGVELLPLLKKEISISKVILTKPEINIIRYPDGTYNFSDMLKKQPGKPAKKTTETAKPSSGIPEGFYLGKLYISDGVINITNVENGKEHEYGLNHINLGVYGFSVKRAFKVSLGVSFDNLKDARLDVNGYVGPTGQHVSVENLPLNVSVSLKHIDIPYVLSLAGVKARTFSAGTLDVDEKLNSESSGVMDINGKIALSGLTLTNGTISPFSVTDNLQFIPKEKLLNINDITLKSDGINLGLKGNTNISTKAINVNLFSRELSMDRLIGFYSPIKESLPQDTNISGDGIIKTDISTNNNVMAINGIIDLSKAKIIYQKMFVKSASVPFSLSYDISKYGSTVDIKDIKLILDKLEMNAVGKVLTAGDMDGAISAHTNTVQVQSLEDVIPMIKSYNAKGSFILTAYAHGAFKKPKELVVQGGLQVKNVSANIASLPKSLKSFNMNALFTRNSATLKSMMLEIGQSEVRASGNINDFSAPQGRLNITSPYLNVDDLMPESKTGKAEKEAKATGKEQTEPSILDKANITISANVKKGVVKKAQFTDLVMLARIVKGSILLDRFDMRTFSGIIAANGTVGMKGEEPYNLKLKASALNLGDMLGMFTSYKDVMSGRLGADVALNGNAKDLKRTVSGKGIITLTDGEIKTFSMLSSLTDIAKLANIGIGGIGKTTKINNMKLDAVIDHGKVSSSDLKLNSRDFDVIANGYFDLDSNLDYHGTGMLSRSISNGVGGTVGQLIKNEQGEVEIPFILTGDIRRPVFKLDAKAYEQGIKEAAKRQVIQQLNKQLNNGLKNNKAIQQLFH
jgi:uncharacterized protein involved in outer membrane biogenesis